MRRSNVMCLLVVLVIMAMLLLPGCNGVQLNAEYSDLLDQTAEVSAEIAKRAAAGEMSEADMIAALVTQAEIWGKFQDGRNGVKGGDR